eukprot:CAMPEP_0204175030 /NCGR_PEP_ID=MMETSP0361-20130328/46396_1 /ASSEMBLY_ACC=CAM_ASM_000343 /TAXON_ID=268821 /ORGANISM="Scrippsiella Hangoei, Strain SHTV-5" /LENGTH=47 /DNA_ID= /DNA_START= /DNA_END= /DNA_ORIENTATION=
MSVPQADRTQVGSPPEAPRNRSCPGGTNGWLGDALVLSCGRWTMAPR